jgi:hypothetical protein
MKPVMSGGGEKTTVVSTPTEVKLYIVGFRNRSFWNNIPA